VTSDKPDRAGIQYRKGYLQHVRELLAGHATDRAMQLAVGGQFESLGKMMLWLLIDEGLKPEDCLIDIGCGSGRLSHALIDYLKGNYLGTDIVSDLLEHARTLCANRSDWRFELVNSIAIPAARESADMVCAFSVFTHLLHEDAYRYLLEVHRVLRPGGKFVFSFLEFRVPATWTVFESMVQARETGVEKQHDQFLSRDAIDVWSSYSGFEIQNIYDGQVPYVHLRHTLKMDDGRLLERMGSLGQSVAILVKKAHL
jgi:ubiquinone/menaquinone biosynthesis C-methylase UbiE